MPELSEKTTFTVAKEHCGDMETLTPVALLERFQDTMMKHSARKGVGSDFMVDNRRGWALVRYDIRVSRWPKRGERFTVHTAPVGVKWQFVYRQFEVTDDAGEVIITADSCWMVIDLDARKRADMPKEVYDAYGFEALAGKALKMGSVKALDDAQVCQLIRVRQGDIDMYGHVNNTVYVRWALETIDGAMSGRHISRLVCTFKREALLGMDVSAKAAVSETQTRHELTDAHGDVLFQMRAEWAQPVT